VWDDDSFQHAFSENVSFGEGFHPSLHVASASHRADPPDMSSKMKAQVVDRGAIEFLDDGGIVVF
jgi:hypothetical protein